MGQSQCAGSRKLSGPKAMCVQNRMVKLPLQRSAHPDFAAPEVPVLEQLEAYRKEVRDRHAFMTAADSFYFTLLRCHRRRDAVDIQLDAVRAAAGLPLEDPASWRERLSRKRAEARDAMSSRARHYPMGTRRSAGLLSILHADSSALESYEAVLDEEHAAMVAEIEAMLSVLEAEGSESEQRAGALLSTLGRNVEFWQKEVEAAWQVWQDASTRFNASQARGDEALGVLKAGSEELLEQLALRPSAALLHLRALLCARLLQLDIQQFAYGMRTQQRQNLLKKLLQCTRADGPDALKAVARILLREKDFVDLVELPVGSTNYCALDLVPVHPWTEELIELFEELPKARQALLNAQALLRKGESRTAPV